MARPAAAASTPSLAVLYFRNASPDTADVAIADGLTEELIAKLSQVRGLLVASRFASIRYHNRGIADPRRVGRDLGVRYVLHGTMRRMGNRLRIVLEITDTAGGYNVWGHAYDRPVDDVFAVQDSVVVQVAEAVLGSLTRQERTRLAPVSIPTTTDAYQAYLRGRTAIRGRTAASASRAIAYYQQAIALDDSFARAYAALAHALALSRDWGWELPGVPSDSVAALAIRAAARALALDSLSPESWLGYAMAERPRSVGRALAYHRRAVALDSTNIETLHQLAWGLFANGKLDTAIIVERSVIVRDPYYAYAYSGLGHMLNVAGRPEEALSWLRQGTAVDSTTAPLYWQIAEAQLRLGFIADARDAAKRARTLGFDSRGARILLALASLQEGDTASAVALLDSVVAEAHADLQRSKGGLAYSTAALISGMYAQLGQPESAVRWARNVAEWPRRLYAVMFARHWFWEPVRSDPRFQALLAELRL